MRRQTKWMHSGVSSGVWLYSWQTWSDRRLYTSTLAVVRMKRGVIIKDIAHLL